MNGEGTNDERMDREQMDTDNDDEMNLDEFERLVQQALNSADPVPSSVSTIAKHAYEFRNYEVVESDNEAELAMARSATTDLQHRYSKGDAVLTWASEGEFIKGNAVNVNSLELQTPEDVRPVQIDKFGAFEIPSLDLPFRWIVDKTWATAWSPGL